MNGEVSQPSAGSGQLIANSTSSRIDRAPAGNEKTWVLILEKRWKYSTIRVVISLKEFTRTAIVK
ncbi:MAG: hypothetical protein ACXAB4_11110 [Candidatus Hodarchaeales archaeon]|jgi:hypothetical protein